MYIPKTAEEAATLAKCSVDRAQELLDKGYILDNLETGMGEKVYNWHRPPVKMSEPEWFYGDYHPSVNGQ